MKNTFIFLITLYQQFISPFFKQLFGIRSFCRYSPSCSMYAKQAIQQQGVLYGSFLSLKRILRCQPFIHTYGSTV